MKFSITDLGINFFAWSGILLGLYAFIENVFFPAGRIHIFACTMAVLQTGASFCILLRLNWARLLLLTLCWPLLMGLFVVMPILVFPYFFHILVNNFNRLSLWSNITIIASAACILGFFIFFNLPSVKKQFKLISFGKNAPSGRSSRQSLTLKVFSLICLASLLSGPLYLLMAQHNKGITLTPLAEKVPGFKRVALAGWSMIVPEKAFVFHYAAGFAVLAEYKDGKQLTQVAIDPGTAVKGLTKAGSKMGLGATSDFDVMMMYYENRLPLVLRPLSELWFPKGCEKQLYHLGEFRIIAKKESTKERAHNYWVFDSRGNCVLDVHFDFKEGGDLTAEQFKDIIASLNPEQKTAQEYFDEGMRLLTGGEVNAQFPLSAAYALAPGNLEYTLKLAEAALQTDESGDFGKRLLTKVLEKYPENNQAQLLLQQTKQFSENLK